MVNFFLCSQTIFYLYNYLIIKIFHILDFLKQFLDPKAQINDTNKLLTVAQQLNKFGKGIFLSQTITNNIESDSCINVFICQ